MNELDIWAIRYAVEAKLQHKLALDRFMVVTNEAAEVANMIAGYITDDHLGVNPDAVTWAWVGSAEKLLNDLRAIAEQFGLVEEQEIDGQVS